MDALASPPPDHSSLIASKLLQGWTLLAESCPVCFTPLVRNRQKQLFCVSCRQWLLTEEQLALKLQAHHVHDSPPASPSSLPPKPQAPAPAPAAASGHMRVASQRDDAPSSDERSPKRQANSTELLSGVSFNIPEDTNMTAPPAGSSHQYPFDLPKVQSSVNPSDVISKTLSTLYQKLEEIRQAIAACQDIRDLQQLLSALGECMQAIQRAHSLVNARPGMVL